MARVILSLLLALANVSVPIFAVLGSAAMAQ